MTQITRDYLVELRERAEHEQRRLLAQAQQAIGVIATISAMIARLDEAEPNVEAPPDLTVEQGGG